MEIIKSDGYYFLISTCDICEGDGVLEVCINNGWYQGSEATPSYAEQPCDVCEGEGKIEEILTEDEWEEQNG